MKKKIAIVAFLLLIIGGIVFLKQNQKQENVEEIPTYPSDVYCKKSFMEEIEGESFSSELRIYITLSDDVVKKVIYQTISSDDLTFAGDQYRELYNTLKGVSATSSLIGGKSVTTITYEYTQMDAKEIKETLGNLLEEESLLARIKEYPITYEEYQSYELEGFDCYEN